MDAETNKGHILNENSQSKLALANLIRSALHNMVKI